MALVLTTQQFVDFNYMLLKSIYNVMITCWGVKMERKAAMSGYQHDLVQTNSR
jgi:hypothetical protein